MASVNKVILIGNLGADPEKRLTGSGLAVCNLRIATNEVWKDKQGNKQERTEWHRIVVYGAQAENCEKYLSKGRPVYIEGSIRTRQWEDQQGQTKYITEIIAQRVQFLGSPGGSVGRSESRTTSEGDSFPPSPEDNGSQASGTGEDDIPF
ncbi:MAG: single-stranded DNA-binding protein [Deltaproteobacteria bacterium RIFCSPLOWO2_02_FULL_46_8]|nr:MAG: single-stranded DNA-binding protein [Deltaproteobacteria bacterium RIFCSPLOWO2_02_FULL_46_8]